MKTIQELVPLIQEWAKERGIFDKSTPFDQLLKTHEEVGELIKACYDNDKPAIQDAIGDTMICLINYCYFIELDVIKKIKQAVELSLPELDIISRVIEVYKSLGRLISINIRNEGEKLSEPSEIRVFSIAHSLNEIALLENTTLEVTNPLCNGLSEHDPWEEHIAKDIINLIDCEGIYMLQGWEDSQGARIEYAVAKELGKVVFYE